MLIIDAQEILEHEVLIDGSDIAGVSEIRETVFISRDTGVTVFAGRDDDYLLQSRSYD